MNTLQLLIAGLVLLAPLVASAQTRTNAPAPQGTAKPAVKAVPAPAPTPAASFDAFKSVPDRNIFNTRRFAGRTSDTPAPAPRRDPVVETFSLLGTLDYPKGSVAFFEGSTSAHNKPVKVDESIGGCKVTAIEAALVRLEANGKPVELQVGYMLRREDDGEWKLRQAERVIESSSSYTSSSSSPFGSGSGSPFGSSSFSSSRDSRSSSSGSSRDSRFSSSFGSSSAAESAQRRIREQDRNGDGKISMEEADSRLRDRFRDMDRNGDRQIDAEEYTAYYASRMGGSSTSTFNTSSSGGSGSSNSSGSPSTAPSSPTSPGASGESDLLKRLMEQRARENR